ncbi:YncE family protein [Flavobacterium psychrotolerans]|uniref:Cell surface protein n=1 Tax=Flavobacterium psychrotolerans TaxID=2169410 RepID=A0A2U1JKF2_9FLAO|nr:DUF5074 domain-containing protein [Flavobacterium psychrotolerans]PWA05358.1 hypothetical protein DB895_07095 [Flavobacterium psychrotolerans]
MNFKKVILLALLSPIFLVSCTKDEDPIIETPLGAYDNGILILNQGGFNKGNASISYLSNDFSTLQNNIFSLVNPTLILGDVAQNMAIYGDLAFIVANISNKIEVVNRYTMAHVATITTGMNNPRYIAFANGKGYVTNWGNGSSVSDDFVAVLDLTNYTVSGTISVVEGPDKIIENNGYLYVAHSGGFGYGNTISVINTISDAVTSTINVGDVPNSMEINNGSLYVLCEGKSSWSGAETAGELDKVDLGTNTVTSSINFSLTAHPSNLDIDNEKLYYTSGSSVYSMGIAATTLPTSALLTISAQGGNTIYSFAVKNNYIYVGDAGDFSANGKVFTYFSSGTYVHSHTVGVIPAGFCFNK